MTNDPLAAYRSGSLTLRQALGAQREPPAPPATVIPDYTEASSRSVIPDDTLLTDSSVIRDYTKDDSRSISQDDSPPPAAPIERATLEHHTGAVHGGDLRRTPWRERPLASFMDWVARVDVTTVPEAARVAARQQISAARKWLGRLELQLEELGSDSAD